MIDKKIFIVLMFFLSITSSMAYGGPKIDCYGKPSYKGKKLYFVLSPVIHNSFGHDVVRSKKGEIIYYKDNEFHLFRKHNQELINWEITKFLKKRLFKLGFFKRGYFDSNSSYCYSRCMFYWIYFPPEKKQSIINLVWYNSFNESRYIKNTLYTLKQFGECAKEEYKELQRRLKKRGYKKLDGYTLTTMIKGATKNVKVDKTTLETFRSVHLTPVSQDDREYNYKIAASMGWFLDNKRIINNKNKRFFYKMMSKTSIIPDDISEKIIKYWGLDGQKGILKIDKYLACAKYNNPKLRKIILKNLKTIKRAKPYSAEDYAIEIYLLGADKVVGKIPPTIQDIKAIIINYARLCGDYNKAFKLAKFLNNKKNKNISSKDEQTLQVNAAYLVSDMLYEKNNLNISYARKIIEALSSKKSSYRGPGAYSSRRRHYHIPKYYGKLLTLSNFKQNPEAVQAIANNCSPEDLDKFLLQALAANENYQKKYPKAYKETHKFLNWGKLDFSKSDFSESDSLQNLPHFIKMLKEDLSEKNIRKICKVLKPLSLYGKPTAPALRNLLKKEKLDFLTKISIMCTLAEIGDKESIPLIKEYTYNKNKLLEKAARQSLYILQDVDEDNEFFKKMLKFELRLYL
jgi:hypothetical protein